MALPSTESDTDLTDTVDVGDTGGSSNISVLTQNVGGRPKIDDIWHHVRRTLTPDGKYEQVCNHCGHSKASLLDNIEDERELAEEEEENGSASSSDDY
jgi:hypothetical protein